jgi:hypothetical protein
MALQGGLLYTHTGHMEWGKAGSMRSLEGQGRCMEGCLSTQQAIMPVTEARRQRKHPSFAV